MAVPANAGRFELVNCPFCGRLVDTYVVGNDIRRIEDHERGFIYGGTTPCKASGLGYIEASKTMYPRTAHPDDQSEFIRRHEELIGPFTI